jgi:hypothetical protein
LVKPNFSRSDLVGEVLIVSAQTRKSKANEITFAVLLAALGLVAPAAAQPAPSAPSSSVVSPTGGCSVNDAKDIEYLLFWGPLPASIGDIDEFAARLGTTGDGKTRQLALGARMLFYVDDETKIVESIKRGFDLARRTNVAIHFNVDDHVDWDQRPDLWNWDDPARKGYDPKNRRNVEWYDWKGTPNKRKYLTPVGAPSQSPHMCYNSPVVEKEVHRIVSQIVGPALEEEINELEREHRKYLFAGITVGQEPGFDDYSRIPKLSEIPPSTDPMQAPARELLVQAATMMEEDKAPHSKVGYCSLTNAGYSKTNPPEDFNKALAGVSQKFIEFWDKQFVDAGIPCSRLYTHIPAPLPQDKDNDVPIWIAFNPFARPGWTTYPVQTLENGLQPLYDALAKLGDPLWGGVEANAAPNPGVDWEGYLAWHYNHGAKLVGINTGASDATLMSSLTGGAFSNQAMAAYRKFLQGKELVEK